MFRLHAAIHEHIDSIADGVNDFRQLIERRSRTVELSPAVVRDDEAGAANVDCAFRVGDGHDSFEANWPSQNSTMCATSFQFIDGSSISVK